MRFAADFNFVTLHDFLNGFSNIAHPDVESRGLQIRDLAFFLTAGLNIP
jgi:hypothetical protein